MSLLMENSHAKIGCGDPGDPIEFGALFDGGYLHRDFVAGDRTKYTEVIWVKLMDASAAVAKVLFLNAAGSASTYSYNYIESDRITSGEQTSHSSDFDVRTARKHSDVSSFFQIVRQVDTGQDDPGLRVRHAVNGEWLSEFFSYSAPAQGRQTYINQALEHYIGTVYNGSVNSSRSRCIECEHMFFDGFNPSLTEFGRRNSFGDWVHKEFHGKGQGQSVYGINGFHLDYSVEIDLGRDVSGNGNHFTVVGVVGRVIDTPTRNFSVLNAVESDAIGSLSDGNLTYITGAAGHPVRPATFLVKKDRWWVEYHSDNDRAGMGILRSDVPVSADYTDHPDITSIYNTHLIAPSGGLQLWDPAWGSPSGSKTVGVGFDADTGDIKVYDETGLLGIGNVGVANYYRFMAGDGSHTYGGNVEVNFGQRPWVIGPPSSDYKALCVSSLDCPVILNPDDYVTERVVIDGSPVADLPFDIASNKCAILSKRFSEAGDWRLTTTLRGAGSFLSPNTGEVEITDEDGIDAFTSNGYSTSVTAAAPWLGSRYDLIIRAGAQAGIDIVDFSHTNGFASPVAFNTGGVIDFLMLFPVGGGVNRLWFNSLTDDQYLRVNSPAGIQADVGWISRAVGEVTFGASLPSGDYIGIGFSDVDQFSLTDFFEGSGLADGPFEPSDFEPLFALIIGASSSRSPRLFPKALNPNNPATNHLTLSDDSPVKTNLEVGLYSNGMKVQTSGTDLNAGGEQFKTFKVAKTPIKFANAV